MLVPHKEAVTLQSAIERRLVETTVSGITRPIQTCGPKQKTAGEGKGLFLVKAAVPAGDREIVPQAGKIRNLRRRNPLGLCESLVENAGRPRRILPMPVPACKVRQDRLIVVMAALGPLLGIGHAVLVWLKAV